MLERQEICLTANHWVFVYRYCGVTCLETRLEIREFGPTEVHLRNTVLSEEKKQKGL